jgi:hypothetical protein
VSPEAGDLLAIFAEIAIGTVALSGITMVFVLSRQDPGERQTGLVAAQLAMASAVVMASVFPLLLGRYGIPETQVWMISSGAYLAIILGLQFLRVRRGSPLQEISGNVAIITSVPGISGLTLLAANFWLRADWPYLTQLLIALGTSMVLYLYFVLSVLSQEQRSQ